MDPYIIQINSNIIIFQPAAIEALCLMLEWEVVSGEQTQLEIIAALQGTELGQKYYEDLCDRQQNLQRLVSTFYKEYCFSSSNIYLTYRFV